MAKLHQWAERSQRLLLGAVKTAGNESAVYHEGLELWPGQDQLA